MTIRPRKLKLLIIDDELVTSPDGYEVVETIEKLYTTEGIPGIHSWSTAMRFWCDFKTGDVPDIVIADVRFFRDLDSPLANLFKAEENNIPTGLSHLKSFAVLCRALGRPVGVSIRTMDSGLWKREINSSKPEHRAMGFLAVQEIGELAAILGDDLGPVKRERAIEACLEWFQKKRAEGFEDGLKLAIRDYRRRLFCLTTSPGVPEVFVKPSQFAELMGWCRQMQKQPRPLDDECDMGLELVYSDGQRDLISLQSLFSDYTGISDHALNASAFAVEQHDDPWKLDDDGRPRIGAFLQSLGSLTAACEEAAEAVRAYSVNYPPAADYHPPKLSAIKGRYSTLSAGLAVVFHLVNIEQKRAQQWEENFVEAAWDARKRQFIIGEKNPRHTLQAALSSLVRLARNYLAQVGSDEPDTHEGSRPDLFTQFELFDAYPDEWVYPVDPDGGDADSEWVKWHFERLVDAKVFTCHIKHGEEYYGIASRWQRARYDLPIPPIPRDFPETLELDPPQRKVKEPDRIKWLRTTLGYAGDFTSIERALAAAFVPSVFRRDPVQTVTRGSEILDELESSEWRPFLLEVAREYAGRIKWPAERRPTWLQPKPVEVHNRVAGVGVDILRPPAEVSDAGILCV